MPTPGWLRRADLPLDAKNRSFIDPDSLDQMLDQPVNWRGDVNGGGYTLYNAILGGSIGFQFYASPVRITPVSQESQLSLMGEPTSPDVYPLRWMFAKDNIAETGSNAGSNLQIRRYDDAGTLIDAPLSINRASGLITLAAQQWAGAADAAKHDLNNLGVLRFRDYVGSSPLLVGIGNEDGTLHMLTDNGGSIDLESIGNGRVMISTDSTRRLVVHQNGNVGIGPSMNPAYTLDVQGQVRSSSGGYVFPDGTVQVTATISSGSPNYAISGNVVGSRSTLNFIQGANVTITGADNAAASRVDITIAASGGGGGSGSQTPWTSDIDAATFKLLNAGAISIGSAAAPAAAKLLVNGSISVTGPDLGWTLGGNRLFLDVAGSAARLGAARGGGGNMDLVLFGGFGGSGASEMMRLAASGFIGIGTDTPRARLHVASGTVDGSGADNTAVRITSNTSSYTGVRMHQNGRVEYTMAIDGDVPTACLRIVNTNGDQKVEQNMRGLAINPSGNVGIGIASAATLLHVAGSDIVPNDTGHAQISSGSQKLVFGVSAAAAQAWIKACVSGGANTTLAVHATAMMQPLPTAAAADGNFVVSQIQFYIVEGAGTNNFLWARLRKSDGTFKSVQLTNAF